MKNANFWMPILFYWHVIFNIVYSLFLKEILLIFTNPLSKVKYYAIRIEFQVKESPHIQFFFCGFWISLYYLIQLYSFYLDTVVSANSSDSFTIIAKPINYNYKTYKVAPEFEKYEILKERENILMQIKILLTVSLILLKIHL